MDTIPAAGLVYAYLKPRVQAREQMLLAVLMQGHRDDTLTEAAMRGAIAALAELRALLADCEREARHVREEG